MREIKFRVWNEENNEMLEVQELDYEDSYDGQPMIRTTKYNDYFDTEDMLLMQYTGLHDKNGKEIYEGDIVYVIPEDEDALIKWDNESAKFAIEFDDYIADFDCYFGKELEVMGNITDNKELLNETNR